MALLGTQEILIAITLFIFINYWRLSKNTTLHFLGTQEILIVVLLFISIHYWRVNKCTTLHLLGTREIFVVVVVFIFIHYWRLSKNTTHITKWSFFGMLPGILLNLSNIHEYSNSILKHHGDVFQRLTFDNICSIVLGYDLNCLSIEFAQVDSGKAFNEVEDALFGINIMPRCIWKLQKWLQVGKENKLIEGRKTIEQLLYDEIKSKRDRRIQG
ncbi:unnamed protein product [Lupinus luteus]|uniref:Uncharacterized protein n=1 Tax=Lupinus luteus TaxID=3873 RepID=A0AAV1YGQ3_LUPLU